MDADGSAGGRRQGADDVEGARDPRIGHKGFGGGGSRSTTIGEFSIDFENSIGSIGKKRQKMPMWRSLQAAEPVERADALG